MEIALKDLSGGMGKFRNGLPDQMMWLVKGEAQKSKFTKKSLVEDLWIKFILAQCQK